MRRLLRAALGGVVACGAAVHAQQAPVVKRATPLVIDVCGKPVAYDTVPQRAVTHDTNLTEMFLFLGLRPRMVGYSGIPNTKEIAPEWKEVIARLPNLSNQGMNVESILSVHADFVYGGWGYGFRPGAVTPDLLARYGIGSYILRESCIHVQKRDRVSLGDALVDLRNISRIFDVEKQNEPKMRKIEADIAALAQRMQGVTQRPKVFVYDSGQRLPVTSGRFGMPNAMIEAAGGDNIFADIPTNWPSGNWEDVIERDPEWIIIVDYGQPNAAGKIEFLLQKKELAQVAAIRKKQFFVISYANATPGPKNVHVAQELAQRLHPERFAGAAP